MLHAIVTIVLSLTILRTISSQNLNGIFLIDSCECNSSSKTCELNGPFTLNQTHSKLAVKYGSKQIGVGTLGDNQLDLYLNQNHCKGSWNGKNHLAELECQHEDDIICVENLRCISGSCLDATSIIISSASITTTLSFLLIISILFMVV